MFFKRKTNGKVKSKRPLSRRIINYFIGTGISLIVILLLAFGYTQTSTFRDWLKDFVTEQVNSSTNGELTIGELGGTIFTSLILTNTLYTVESDTLFAAEKIELKVSPLRVFLKTIYLRKLEIENANLNFIQYEDGELNLSKITTPSTEEEVKDTVTTSEPFSWKIDVADLKLKNFDFRHQTISNRYSTQEYPQPNMDDFRLENINLSLSAVANIADNEYQLYISEFSVKPNLAGFNLVNLSGNFVLLNDIAGITDLELITDKSDISINAAISDFTPFSDEEFKIENSPLKLELDASKFNFDDLTNFIDGTDLLKGTVETEVNVEGTLSALELKTLQVNFNETRLQASGYLQNVLDGGDMMIETRFTDSYVNQDDVNNLLHTIDIPVYKSLGVLQFDTLFFAGKPLNFDAGLAVQTNKGRILGTVKMDMTGEEIVYDYRLMTNNLDLESIAGLKTNLNLNCEVVGKGFSPENLETTIEVSSKQSTIGELVFNDLDINATGKDGIIETNIAFSSSETVGKVKTSFNFTDTTSTTYNFDIALNGFNINDFVKDSELTTELNITLKGDGENFDQDNLNLFAVLQLDSSSFNDIEIDSTTLIADVRSGEDNRVINIISDLADLTITGKFRLLEIVDVISEEADLISTSIKNKIDRIQPPKFIEDEITITEEETIQKTQFTASDRNVSVQYLLELKSFEMLSLFLGGSEIEVDGEISGRIFAQNDSVSVLLETEIERMQFWDGANLYYLSDFDMSLMIDDKVSANSFDEFIAELQINSDKIFTGSEIDDLKFNLNFNKNSADIELYAIYDELTTIDVDGSLIVNTDDVTVKFEDLLLKYRNFDLRNSGEINFNYSDNNFDFKSFTLVHNGGEVKLDGEFSLTDKEDLSLKISRFNLSDISTNLFGVAPEKSFRGELNLDLSITGEANDPEVKLSLKADSVKIQQLNLGSLESNIDYSDKLMNLTLFFYEVNNVQLGKSLELSGKLPIDLAMNAQNRFPEDDMIDLELSANEFDLRFLSGLVPGITNPNGVLNGDVKFSGPYDNISSDGELNISKSSLILDAVNLKYLVDAKIEIEDDKIILANLRLRNEPGIPNGGTINAYGEITHQNYSIDEITIRAAGDLKILDESSRAVNPAIYGNITIKTRNEIVLKITEERSSLTADLILKDNASVTYSPAQSAFSNENDKFNYIFVSTEEEDLQSKQIDSLIQVSQQAREKLTEQIPFDLDLRIEVENEAKMVFVLSREFKQNLTAYLGGDFRYKVVDNETTVGGELTLLDGSKLDFIKTFRAEGNVRFLDELTNPYVNVLATYESFYSTDTLTTSTNEYEVQIRIRLEGPAESLTTNFLRNEENIEVYKRRRGATQWDLDAAKTASDAMFFIIVNKFPEDATLQESNLAVSTAASLAGSIVGNVLNERLGDVVRSVNVQQVGTETRVSLIGKVEEFRYEIGGTSQVFQDLSRANVKIERPILFPNLIIRFDRREPSYQSATFSEMINELGLKYSFIF